MCGRFTLRTDASDLVEIFTLLRDPELTPRFNIAPTSRVEVARQSGKTREISLMRWGLVPSWSKDPKAGPPPINARAARVASFGCPRTYLLCFGAKIRRVSKGKR